MWSKIIKGSAELLAGAAIIAGSVYYYNTTLSKKITAKKKAPSVPVVVVERQKNERIKDIIEALGTGSARESVDITATVTAKVVRINFEDGDFVTKDSLLIQLDDNKEQAEKRQAEINIAEQEREMLRIEKLVKGRAASQKSYDEQKTNLARSKTVLAIVNTQIADRYLKAPFKGRLGMRLVSLGDLVSPGTKITTLDDITKIHVDFSIPEKYFASLKKGCEITVSNAAYPGTKFHGVISAIAPRINQQTRMVEVRATIDNEDRKLRPGMMFNVKVDMGELDALMIPEKAVTSLGEIQSVFLYQPQQGFVRKKEVRLGRRMNGRVEVISGVRSGDVIVVEGVSKLVNGMKVNLERVAQTRKDSKDAQI